MAKTNRSNLLEFCRAIWSEWFTAMSGPLSVPAAIAALWIENTTAKILLGLTAFACIWAAAYSVWRRERENVLALEYAAASGAQESSLPDFHLHELFSHIDPEVLSRADDGVSDRWDEIANEIRDRAALGALKIWGRPVRDNVDSLLGQRQALRLIGPSYWTMAFFTYSFFDGTADNAPHTYLEYGRSGVEYTDLQVNRAEALRIWPAK
jgi:hypothetical protein